MKNQDNYLVIMAGGVGSRLWPMSQKSKPKQFQDLLGKESSLFQLTWQRYSSFIQEQNVYVVTNQDYKGLVKQQLPFLNDEQILCEPIGKNTAPCLAYASFKIGQINPNANLIVAASDHLIKNEAKFIGTIKNSIDVVKQQPILLTIGVKPEEPNTGYGYICVEQDEINHNDVKKVVKFTEKPGLKKAKEFISKSNYYWNSGMFIWNVQTILNAFKTNSPSLFSMFDEVKHQLNTDKESQTIGEIYSKCDSVSVDVAIMENAQNVSVILVEDIGWSDLGTWNAIYKEGEKDEHSNHITGVENVRLQDSKNNVVVLPEVKEIVMMGIEDCMVIQKDGKLLIAKRSYEQDLKNHIS